ncbi:single-stranded DNA-binding protein [Bdellovibrionota bacterium FG-2]
MSTTNQIIITGNLGSDPEVFKKNEESNGVVVFSLAESISRLNEKTKEYEQVHTNWFPVRSFGSLGARVKSTLKKGERVSVIGTLKTYQYETEDGRKVSAFEILASDISYSKLLPKGEASSALPTLNDHF